MDTTELIAKYRQESDDSTSPYLFDDAAILILFNEAIHEACTRKDLLFDSTTTAVCQVDVVEDTRTYDVHESITRITKAYLIDSAGNYIYLDIKDREELDRIDPTWRENEGEPEVLIFDETSITFNKTPEADYTLKLEVYRTPLSTEDLTLVDADPEVLTPAIATAHHRYLHHYPLMVVYNSDEPELYAPQKAKNHEDKFNRYFGLPPDADRKRKSQENRPHRNKLW